jgi:hypothetical protein
MPSFDGRAYQKGTGFFFARNCNSLSLKSCASDSRDLRLLLYLFLERLIIVFEFGNGYREESRFEDLNKQYIAL